MSEIPKLMTTDGTIDELELIDENTIEITSVTLGSDYQCSALKEEKPFQTSFRSGNAQLGFDLVNKQGINPEIERGNIIIPNQKILTVNPLLGDAIKYFNRGDEVGRIIIMDPELRIKNIEHYLHKKLFIDTPFEIKEEKDTHTGHVCHYAEVSLLDLVYNFEEDAISSVSINRIIKEGRAAIETIRSKQTGINLKKTLLNPGEFFVGAIKISLGDIVAVIDTEVEPKNKNIRHLPATVLDPFRTSRIRQVELINNGKEPVALSDIKIKIRFFKAENPLSFPLQKEKIKNGYTLVDLVTIPQLEKLFDVYDDLKNPEKKLNKEVVGGKKLYGAILNKGKVTPVPQALNPDSPVQREMIKSKATESMGGEQEDSLTPKLSCTKQEAIQKILKNLSIMGGRNSKLWLSNVFPNEEIISTLRHRGIRTFLSDQTELFITDKFFKGMIDLTHKIDQPCEFLRFDRKVEKLLTFHHGLFMEPEDKERFDKVRYWFAFYGSHKDKMDENLVMSFLSKLVTYYDGSMGVIQGSGPGLMKNANSLARLNNVFSAGVGIDLAYKDQKIITSCDGFAAFPSGQRHSRAHTMDKLTSFPIINTGGFGTLEEISSTLTSLKLHENPLAPLIFLDPQNFWADVLKQIQKIADEDLGQDYIPKLCIPVKTAEEGFRAIQEFTNSPEAWYKKRKIPPEAIQEAQKNSNRIRFENLGMRNTELFEHPFK